MNRYQKPDVYQKLAMNYVVGSMPHLARKRFKQLMQDYSFIAATVESYEEKLAHLALRMPEQKPDQRVWQAIEASLKDQQAIDQASQHHAPIQPVQSNKWNLAWQWVMQRGYVLSVVCLMITGVYLLQSNPELDSNEPALTLAHINEMKAEIKSYDNGLKALATASKQEMLFKVSLKQKIAVPKGKQVQIWCLHSDGSPPVNMGFMAGLDTMSLKLTPKSWQGLIRASQIAISFEPVGSQTDLPKGEYIYQGDIALSS